MDMQKPDSDNSFSSHGADGKLYILGHPVAHSKSPVMYNALYSKLDIPWIYDFKDCETAEEAQSFIESKNYVSINVTTPYKPEAYKGAAYKAASAQLARGANLLVVKDDALIGYNVDGQGCISFLERQGVRFSGKKVAVCGTGPTALSILIAAVQAGASEVLLLGRDKIRARDAIGKTFDTYEYLASTAIDLPSPVEGHPSFVEAYEKAEFKFGSYDTSKNAIASSDVIVDATPLGMHEGDPVPFDTSLLSKGQVVMDTVYGHGKSALIRSCEERGITSYDGGGMLVAQAVISATIVCEVNDIDLTLDFNEIFDLMSKAAAFDL